MYLCMSNIYISPVCLCLLYPLRHLCWSCAFSLVVNLSRSTSCRWKKKIYIKQGIQTETSLSKLILLAAVLPTLTYQAPSPPVIVASVMPQSPTSCLFPSQVQQQHLGTNIPRPPLPPYHVAVQSASMNSSGETSESWVFSKY